MEWYHLEPYYCKITVRQKKHIAFIILIIIFCCLCYQNNSEENNIPFEQSRDVDRKKVVAIREANMYYFIESGKYCTSMIELYSRNVFCALSKYWL